MFAAFLIPGLILGAIAWGAVGVLRSRGKEQFTLATAANFYAQVMLVAGVLAVLAGIGVLIKVGISQIDTAYSYYMPTPYQVGPGGYFGPTIGQQQTQDLILSLMLVGVGAFVSVGHWFLSRFLSGSPGAAPTWITRGTLVALTVLCGLEAVLATLVGGFQLLTYFIVGNQEQNPMQFGDAVGTAVVFLPAWIAVMTALLRRARHPSAKSPTPMVAASA